MVKICFNILLAFVYIINFKLCNYLQKQLKYGLFKLRGLFGRFFDSSFTGYICSISLFLEGQKFWKYLHDLYILRFRLCGCVILYFIMNNTIKAISSSATKNIISLLVPKVWSWTKVRRLCRTVHYIGFISKNLDLSPFESVFCVIALLENSIFWRNVQTWNVIL